MTLYSTLRQRYPGYPVRSQTVRYWDQLKEVNTHNVLGTSTSLLGPLNVDLARMITICYGDDVKAALLHQRCWLRLRDEL